MNYSKTFLANQVKYDFDQQRLDISSDWMKT